MSDIKNIQDKPQLVTTVGVYNPPVIEIINFDVDDELFALVPSVA